MRSFGLIGFPLSHSFSKAYFTQKFESEGVDAIYENFPITSMEEFPALLAMHPELEGINVTIPYKEAVLPFLNSMSDVVRTTGACNCIRIRNGQLEGFNTDVTGFEKSLLKSLEPRHTKALVLGTGGASKAVQYVLRKLRISYTVISRIGNPEKSIVAYNDLDNSLQEESLLWINTTPLGMYPDTEKAPPLNYSCVGVNHYLYDLVYNPAETLFLRKGKERGAVVENGQDMLLIQAEEGWKIWNSD